MSKKAADTALVEVGGKRSDRPRQGAETATMTPGDHHAYAGPVSTAKGNRTRTPVPEARPLHGGRKVNQCLLPSLISAVARTKE